MLEERKLKNKINTKPLREESSDPMDLGENILDLKRQEIMKREAEEYLAIHQSNRRPIAKKYHESRHFLKWAIKLLVPDFLIGHPNLWDNLKILRKHPQFKSLRMALMAWIFFSITVISVGIFSIATSPGTHAANDFSIKTGYYYGNGSSALSITGIGFTPEMVLIKSDSAAGALIWKSSAMPAAVTSYLGVATADNSEYEIILDANGFTVNQALEVNTINTRYTFIAFAGSDCSSGGAMCIGSYEGSGTTTSTITVGFQPALVWTKRTTALAGNFRVASTTDNHAHYFSATANDTTGIFFRTLDPTGFTVGATNNTNGGIYYYAAFKQLPGKLITGVFTGDGVDSRNITGVGFEPDFVLIKQNSAVSPAFNTTEMWGDLSSLTTAAANAVNHIQSLDADGFQVGNSTGVNANTILSAWFAFGGSPDPAPSGSFFMTRGSYTGSGVIQSITTTFAPDLIFIKGNSLDYGVWSMRPDNDTTHYFANSAVGFGGGVLDMSSTGFRVGTSTVVNTNGNTYEYIAFGGATSPHTGNGAADFAIGYLTGNGVATRTIDHFGFDPDMIVIKRPLTTAALSVWRSSSMATNTAQYFSATASSTDGTIFQTLNSDGFTIGSGATVNTVNVPYAFFAFKEGSYFDVGSYSGDGLQDRQVTGLGFTPDYVWTKRDSNASVAAVHKSSNITSTSSQQFINIANDFNKIKTFISDGFTVGTTTEVNASTGTYKYAAWDSTLSSNPPSTPTNSTPENGSSTQDLNTVLTGSVYFDADSNSQTDAQYQVDDDSDFTTPVWTRTAGSSESTTTITSAKGTFANELSGKTELDHNTTYYWRVRYSDGVWSSWSSATNFITNIITTPTHSFPADGTKVTTLTPTLTASVFSDAQTSHTSTSAQWQINSSDSFSSPAYDSGVVSYSNSLTVPSATLSDRNVYHWRVRYKDSSGQWSSYSTSTQFLVEESIMSVSPLFGSTVVDQGDNIKIDAQVKLTNGTVINDATTTINIYNPSGTKIVDEATMSYLSGSSGIYRYPHTVASTSGSYLYEVTAVSSGTTGYAAANFEVRTIAADVSSTRAIVVSEQALQVAERASQAAERASQAAERVLQTANRATTTDTATKVADIQTKVTDVQTKVTTLQSNVDILIGAMIVTQSTVSDASPSTTGFVTALSNSTNDFYKNAVLTFTSSTLDGQSRRISAYNGTTKRITLDPALTSAPANGDSFTIVAQNVRVEEQVADHEAAEASERSAQSDFRASTNAALTNIESKIDTITTNLNTVDANLDLVLSSVNLIRASQQLEYKVELSDVSEIQAGNTYRTKLTILNFESNPTDASSTPTIFIYDATRSVAQATTTMTRISTGVYEYTSSISASSTTGLWETIVNVNVGGSSNIIRNDYWQVTGAPAQVVINSIDDYTVPSIDANVTITNEGNGAFEYHYEWCVVSSQENQCGGNDDVYYGSGAKLIAIGADFNPTLTATVPSVGDYLFKVVVYFGTEASGASRTFTAVADSSGGGGGGSPSSGGSFSVPGGNSMQATSENIYAEIIKARNQLDLQSQKLNRTLEILNVAGPSLGALLEVNNLNTENLIDVQNKVADLRAVSAATRRIVEQKTMEPVVETYMKFNSVEINFLITNPDSNQQVVKFKAFLPEEAKPEHIIDLSGLKVDYDTNAKVYYVSGDIALGPKEVVTRKVEMKDIWVFGSEEIKSIKEQASGLSETLAKTQYEAQGSILKNDINSTVNLILLRQEESYSSPQDHIVVYRENKEQIRRAESNLEKLKDLVVQAGASRGVVGQVGGIQTFATWGIILAIVFGFALLAAIIFSMWRHQTMLAAVAMGMSQDEATTRFSGGTSNKNKKVSKKDKIPEIEITTPQSSFIWNLPWKKILIGFVVVSSIVILGILVVKFVPALFSGQDTAIIGGKDSAAVDTPIVLKQESLGSQLIPENQKNAEVILGNDANNKSKLEDTPSVNQRLKIQDTPTGWLNVRDEASLEGKTINKVYPDNEFEFVDQKDNWYQIILEDETRGWIFGSYIEVIKN